MVDFRVDVLRDQMHRSVSHQEVRPGGVTAAEIVEVEGHAIWRIACRGHDQAQGHTRHLPGRRPTCRSRGPSARRRKTCCSARR